jgi:hypothetical protein
MMSQAKKASSDLAKWFERLNMTILVFDVCILDSARNVLPLVDLDRLPRLLAWAKCGDGTTDVTVLVFTANGRHPRVTEPVERGPEMPTLSEKHSEQGGN